LHASQSIRLLNNKDFKLEKIEFKKYLELETHEAFNGFFLKFSHVVDLRDSQTNVGIILEKPSFEDAECKQVIYSEYYILQIEIY